MKFAVGVICFMIGFALAELWSWVSGLSGDTGR